MTFTVMTVCAANICRSPLMAVSLERAFFSRGFAGDVVVRSVGAVAGSGEGVCPDAARLARSRGLPSLALDRHRSTPLTEQLIDGADLILTADRGTRSEIIKCGRPSAIERTFTLREAAQLATTVSHRVDAASVDGRLRGMTAQLNHSRGFTDLPDVERVLTLSSPWRRLDVHSHDVPDAHGEPGAPHRLVFRLIIPNIDRLAIFLASGALGRQQ